MGKLGSMPLLPIPEPADPLLRARALFGRCYVALTAGDLATIAVRAAEGLSLTRDLDDIRLTSRLLAILGAFKTFAGEKATGLEEAVTLARQAGDSFSLAFSLNLCGISYLMRDPPTARRVFRRVGGRRRSSGQRARGQQFAGRAWLVSFLARRPPAGEGVPSGGDQRGPRHWRPLGCRISAERHGVCPR